MIDFHLPKKTISNCEIKMSDILVLRIDDSTLSLQQFFRQLKDSDKLGEIISYLAREHLINKGIEQNESLGEVSSEKIDQSSIDFRQRNNLLDRDAFESWLSDNRMSYEDFRAKIEKGLKYEHLRQTIAGDRVDEFFAENKSKFDRFSLCRLVVADEALAAQLRENLDRDSSQFYTLVGEHSISYDRELNGRMGVFPRDQIPEQVQPHLKDAQQGDIVGPIVVDDHHCFFLLDKIFPAELNDGLRAELTERLFEEWMQEKIQALDIQLLV
jgi:parvulin-like peptidyl-prolyl isomerase